MATVNIGNIKLNWKGAYNAGTAYVIDDVVSYNGSSYVCIAATTGNLPTVTAKWNQMSAAGTNGTDLTTTLTAQGDIVYRNASGLVKLGAGTSGQLLQTGGSGANPSWTNAPSGKVKQLITNESSTDYTQDSSGQVHCANYDMTITPQSTSSKIIVVQNFNMFYSDANGNSYHESQGYSRTYREISGGATTMLFDDQHGLHEGYVSGNSNTQNNYHPSIHVIADSPNTTAAVTYQLYARTTDNNYRARIRHFSGYLMEVL